MNDVEISGSLDQLLTLEKQLIFAMAKTVTQVEKLAQGKAIENIQRQLNPRSEWYLPSNALGVRITVARPTNPTFGEVKSAASFLTALETAQEHDPTNGAAEVAVPSYGVRPTGRELIPTSMRPRNLANAVLIQARDGRRFIFIRTGPGRRDLKLAYVLEPHTSRPQKTPLTDAVKETFEKEYGPAFAQNLADAIATAR
jgi:hypothetical protein